MLLEKCPGVRIIRGALHSPFYFVCPGAPFMVWASPVATPVQASNAKTPCSRVGAMFYILPTLFRFVYPFPLL